MNLKEDGGMEYRRKALERKEKGEMIKIIFKFKKKKNWNDLGQDTA